MPELLFLTQRIPYPPFKGEKIRPLQILRFLRERYTVHLGCLVDDPVDWQYVPELQKLCGETYFAPLAPRLAKIACLRGLLTGDPLSVTYFHNRGLDRWVRDLLARRHPQAAFVSSSAMAQYLLDRPFRPQRMVMDFVDVDSDKWRQYAETHSGPMRWVYDRESRRLLEFDRKVGRNFDTSTFISRAETQLFKSLAPELADKIDCVKSGVDTDYFSPANGYKNPYADGAPVAVFTGTMDYWPNVDAVAWFAKEILPAVRERARDFQFYIVGASPNAQVQELAKLPGVAVTGRVEDVRPYVAYASMSVAPLRVARGLQNKVLEAMAMGKVVVASPRAMAGIEPEAAHHVVIADEALDFSRAVLSVLDGKNAELGAEARRCMLDLYNWQRNLAGLLPHLAQQS